MISWTARVNKKRYTICNQKTETELLFANYFDVYLAMVVERVKNSLHRIKHYPVDGTVQNGIFPTWGLLVRSHIKTHPATPRPQKRKSKNTWSGHSTSSFQEDLDPEWSLVRLGSPYHVYRTMEGHVHWLAPHDRICHPSSHAHCRHGEGCQPIWSTKFLSNTVWNWCMMLLPSIHILYRIRKLITVFSWHCTTE